MADVDVDVPGPTLIAMLGPVKAGKTSMLVTLRETAQSTHGFTADVELALNDLVGDDPSTPPLQGLPSDISNIKWTTLQATKRNAIVDNDFRLGSTLNSLTGYCFKLTCRFGEERDAIDVVLVDGGGGLMVPKYADEENLAQDPNYAPNRESYLAVLKHATGIVLCVDIFEDNFDDWKDSFQIIQALISDDSTTQGKFIAVAFTKTEQLFILDGPQAVLWALNPHELRSRLRRAVQNRAVRQLLETLQTMRNNAARMVDVRCFATSVYGYVLQNGCANCNHDGTQMLLRDDELASMSTPETVTRDLAISKFWRPVSTVDPFVHAAGIMGPLPAPLAFEVEDLLQTAVERDPGSEATF